MARAKYRLIADDLRRRIDSGELDVGSQLASQQSMATEYGVTVMTLRHALAELERDGLVRTVHGTGTFVATRRTVSFGLDRLSSFAQEMAQQGLTVTTDVLGHDDGWDDGLRPADRIDLSGDRTGDGDTEAETDDVVTVLRRRSVDGRAIVVQRSTMARARWRRIADVDLGTESLYGALDRLAGVRVERAVETFRAVALDQVDAELLGIAEGTACLESTRISFADDDRPFLVDRALLLGSASEVRAERTADDLRLGYTAT